MSGAYVFQGNYDRDLHALASLLSGQLAHGDEPVNHYTSSEGTLLGCVSQDKFKQGFMPRYFDAEGLWGLLLGELHESELLDRRRKEFGREASDIELLVRLFAAGLLRTDLPRLNGAFFLILWNPQAKTLVAANDRYGLYPMYWSRSSEGFCLASRVLCSVLAGVVEGEWDPAGVAQILTTDDYLGETTLVKGVSAFPQATLLIKDDNRLSWHRYWHYKYTDRITPEQMDETAGEIGERLVRAVKRQSARADRVGVTLSGGLDSRCLVAAASKAGVPVQTFTWARPGAYDREYAKLVAEAYHTQHHDCDYALEPFAARFDEGMRLTEGLIDYFDCHMLAHIDILGQNADLILNGYAGDLILGGSYLRGAWMKPLPVEELSKRLFSWRNTLLDEADVELALADGDALAPEQRPSVLFRQLLEKAQGPSTGDTVDRFVLENRVRRVTSMGTVIMRRSVESAAPFFDYDLVDLIMDVPPEQRAEHRIYKAVMARSFPEALELPWQRTLLKANAPDWAAMASKGFLKVVGKIEKKIGFPRIASRLSPVDFGAWLRGPLKPWMEAVINEPHPTANEILSTTFCRSMWHDHLAGRDRTRMLGALAAVRGFSQALKRARGKARAVTVQPVEVWSPD